MHTCRHLCIVPDANRRWAKAHGKEATRGHTCGLINGRNVTEAAFEAGVEQVTFHCASHLNLMRREAHEVTHLYTLLKIQLKRHLKDARSVGVRVCGMWEQIRPDKELKELVEVAHARPITGQVLTLLFGYSGAEEYADVIRRLVSQTPGSFSNELIRSYLWTGHLREVDLMIRTGCEGDPHWSDILPWQMGSAQLHFTPIHWPAFTPELLHLALKDFEGRERRLGR